MDMLKTTSPLTAFFPTDEAFDKMDPAMRFKLLSGEGCVGGKCVRQVHGGGVR